MNTTLWGATPGMQGDVVVIGAPFAHGSSRGGGLIHAPTTLRALTQGERIDRGLWDYATRRCVVQHLRLADCGDIVHRASMSRDTWWAQVEAVAHAVAVSGAIPLGLGGDHTITLPMVTGVARALGHLQVVQLDAHHDYTCLGSDTRPTHSNFVSFLATRPGIDRIVQIGVRGYSSFRPDPPAGVIEACVNTLSSLLIPGVPVYLTIDTDAFDPMLAPAVGHPIPGGLTWKDLDVVLEGIFELSCSVVGADWTEYDPDLDGRNHQTGTAITLALVRILSLIERQRHGG